ncbi:MAG: ubiquinone biosynthesis regulatory protein kinase UbiB [Neisseriaceae bacterium]
MTRFCWIGSMNSLLRLLNIFSVIRRYGLADLLRSQYKLGVIRYFFVSPGQSSNPLMDYPLPKRLRLALEELGPIFVKFGQLLSTRPDIFPKSYIEELALLQNQVVPFDGGIAKQQIEKDFKRSIEEIYYEFETVPVASASVAQVHRAYLRNKDQTRGAKVAVKVIRPHIKNLIRRDIQLLEGIFRCLEWLSGEARRLRLREVLIEFKKYLRDEINLLNEASNGSLLYRQFLGSSMLQVPEIYFDYCTRNILTLEWMDGVPVSNIEELKRQQIDLQRLSEFGVEIFLTQVFNHGFFHADMHPGNILVAQDGRYIALDFGIFGSLTEHDKRYLAINFLAFFNRDYYRVAEAHIESGWAPAGTRVDELEAAIRYVCEPVFNQPLARISFGLILLRLFEVSRQFNIVVQPQLVLLQKTLLNVEGLGRQLNPDLDLWAIGKPFFVSWTKKQLGIEAFWKNLKKESSTWSRVLPALPRKLEAWFEANTPAKDQRLLELRQLNRILRYCAVVLSSILALDLLRWWHR